MDILIVGKTSKRLLLNLAFLLLVVHQSLAQSQKPPELILKIDTTTFSSQKNNINYQGQTYTLVKVKENHELWEVAINLAEDKKADSLFFEINPSISIIDPLHHVGHNQWKGIVRMENLLYAANTSIVVLALLNTGKEIYNFKILPVFETNLQYRDEINDILQEEEKTIEIPAKNAFNIIADNVWNVNDDYDYKVSYSAGILAVTIRPHTLGYRELALNLKTIKPILSERGQITNQLPLLRIRFNVRPNQLYFLNADKTVIYADPNFRNSEEILIDYNKNISLKRTYRIEDQSEEEGNLVAELIPVSVIENNSKILCKIKPYSLHRISDGYLYIKENNRPRFITNFNIWEKPRISGVFIRHEGEDWINSTNVFPGEELDIRLEGKGLENARVQFGGISEAEKDSLRISEEAIYFHLKIPIGIATKTIPIILNKKSSPFELYVKEFQKPAELDFVMVNYGEDNIQLTSEKLNKPIFFEKALNDINFVFNPAKIDEKKELFGKQYLTIQVKIFNRKNDLIEIQQVDNIVVCPGDNSPRKLFYDLKDCNHDAISLNDYLIHKTYQLEPFSQIEILVSENENKYGGRKGYSKKIKIILTRKVHFDVQVTFPAGLLVKKFKETGYGNLTGISTSILAQFNFYNPRLIGKLRPYNIGAGFIALNAFNFSNNSNNLRDVGIVALGSITPTRRDAKFSLPIYAGGGYLLKANSWFLLFGPGIQLNF